MSCLNSESKVCSTCQIRPGRIIFGELFKMEFVLGLLALWIVDMDWYP